MCGIAGFWDFSGSAVEDLGETVARMAGTLRHRGPDDQGIWVDKANGVALGHRRLSILDLSVEGNQPMFSRTGRFAIVFNGEIYNFQILRSELDGPYRGHSDTEVMLAAFEQWGVEQSLRRFNGMFAFALWDRDARALFLGRDRLGEKPLYYAWSGKRFLFGSELKALCAHPDFAGEIDRDSLALFIRHNYVPAPYSIYKGVSKLPPGTFLCLDAGSVQNPVKPRHYWSARQAADAGLAQGFAGSDEDAREQLDTLLRDAVNIRMVADVPLGAFLSGGIDSSTIVAMMQAQSSRPVKTFSIGFHERDFNEAGFAKDVAKHLGTDHTELYVTSQEAMSVIPRLPMMYDEPFADSSQIPTFLVSKLARQKVTVSLSGDGGDELFGGYTRYAWGQQIWNSVGWAPGIVRRAAGTLLQTVSPTTWSALFAKADFLVPHKLRQSRPGDKLTKLGMVIKAADPESMYGKLIALCDDPTAVVLGAAEPPTVLTQRGDWIDSDFTHRMMYLDTMSYLPDDILVKLDRASMAVSLESRVPFLDHRVLEFAWRLPLQMKARLGQGKWILRRVLDQYVPAKLIDRPKIGFGVPIQTWLRGPLRDWAEDLLDGNRLRQDGYLSPGPIRRKWQEHLCGQRNWADTLWGVLMFQAWLENRKSSGRESMAALAGPAL